jgi:beta-lactamase superfamily II metal-dependent hydrolase
METGIMGYDIDFMAVGDNGKSGDAIALRYGDLNQAPRGQTVVVIDGGFTDDGRKLVDLVRDLYSTDSVDVVVSTHPDSDHANGLQTVLSELSVGQLWMHRPWLHTDDIARMFRDGRVTDSSVREHLRRSLDSARSLESLALRKGITIVEPFEGLSLDGALTVLGPSESYYESLLPDFRGTPEAARGALREAAHRLAELVRKVLETWDLETLTDDGETSAENSSSTVIQLTIEDRALLFTGDAGIPALQAALDARDARGLNGYRLRLLQVPHHGSRRNVGPTLLDRLLGGRVAKGTEPTSVAFVSAAKNGEPKHPAKKVTNALQRRGASVHATQGEAKWFSYSSTSRDGYTPSIPLPFYEEVED